MIATLSASPLKSPDGRFSSCPAAQAPAASTQSKTDRQKEGRLIRYRRRRTTTTYHDDDNRRRPRNSTSPWFSCRGMAEQCPIYDLFPLIEGEGQQRPLDWECVESASRSRASRVAYLSLFTYCDIEGNFENKVRTTEQSSMVAHCYF